MGVLNRTKTFGDKMASKAFKQDLPPEGGYAPVNFKRIPARTIIQGKWLLGAFVAYQTWAAYMYGAYWRPATKARKTNIMDSDWLWRPYYKHNATVHILNK